MSPAVAAAFILFNGNNLEGWRVLSGEWAVRNTAIICETAPALIRTTFESDAYDLTFEYRRANEAMIRVNADLQGGGKLDRSAPVHHFSLTPSGLVVPENRLPGKHLSPEAWITVRVSVGRNAIVVRSSSNDGTVLSELRDGDALPKAASHPATDTEPSESRDAATRRRRGFIAFRCDKPGLQIRNVKVTESGFQSLFDGRSLKGWESVVKPDNWYVEDGVLCCRHKGGCWLRTQESYDNFVLRLEYWLPPKGNSGVYLHAPLEGRVSQTGQEIQLLDDAGWAGRTKPSQANGSVYAGIAPEVNVPAPAKEWNAIEIFSQGKRIRTTVNGVQLYDARLDDVSRDAQLLKHPLATRRLTGFIGLQDHSESPRFRNIRIRPLPAGSQPSS